MSREVKFSNPVVWLMLLREGGRWTASEVGERINLDQTSAAASLRTMTEFGTLRRWDRSETNDRVRFGVTAECKVPRGVTLQDILACDLQRAQA